MNTNETYKCPKCKKGTLVIKEEGNNVDYRCLSCGYHYLEERKAVEEPVDQQIKSTNPRQRKKMYMGNILTIFNIINKFGGVLIVVLLILLACLFSVVSLEIQTANSKIASLTTDFSNSNIKLENSIKDNMTNVNNNFNNINTKLSTLETELDALEYVPGSLTTIQNNINILNQNITHIEENISDLWFASTGMGNPKRNLTITYFANQTGSKRYCHVNFLVEKGTQDLNEIKFSLRYQKVNITLLNWTGYTKPQLYQWINGNHTDNYYLYWFEKNTAYSAKYNITWSISDYNTSKISKTNFKYNLMLNGSPFTIDTIWEKEIL
jgi:Zn ribbon nucleic-acid-binding protein/uncharacterized protein YoxC